MFENKFIILSIILTSRVFICESLYNCEIYIYSNNGIGCEISLQAISDGRIEIELQEYQNLSSNVSLAEINWIDIEFSLFSTTPKLILDSFSNLKHVDISDSTGLSNLDDVPFLSKQLLGASIFKTDLATIEQNTLQGLSELVELKMVDNLIKYINKNAFKDLTHLKILEMGYNKIESLDDELFSFNIELESVSFVSNYIKKITARLLASNTNLQRVDFERNKIAQIEQGFAGNLKKIKILDFRMNICIDTSIDSSIEIGTHQNIDDLIRICRDNFH